ncbi:hypothetical protein BCR36DRAFT_185175 [Piromyces finnis]|uniref:Uncharacterized protein n=1 Tax=Piromyces finnis TaxID=1754191 RepID=A0A1Y1VG91_9FUNG|nr:hypothetical protein BCR36DRAFT_185175 [Piromyces finnis]|eukprot:ORX55379.1 hypothetical protein BCR36DRAFT_185175 [Piromyces finnis]
MNINNDEKSFCYQNILINNPQNPNINTNHENNIHKIKANKTYSDEKYKEISYFDRNNQSITNNYGNNVSHVNSINIITTNELTRSGIPNNYQLFNSNFSSPSDSFYKENNYPYSLCSPSSNNPNNNINLFHHLLINNYSNNNSNYDNSYTNIGKSMENLQNQQNFPQRNGNIVTFDSQSGNFDPTASIISCPPYVEQKQNFYSIPNNNPSALSLPGYISPQNFSPLQPYYTINQKIEECENETQSMNGSFNSKPSNKCSVKKGADLEIIPINLANSPLTVFLNLI